MPWRSNRYRRILAGQIMEWTFFMELLPCPAFNITNSPSGRLPRKKGIDTSKMSTSNYLEVYDEFSTPFSKGQCGIPLLGLAHDQADAILD